MLKEITNFRGKYEFLSNFYEHTIVHNKITYITLEHAYQACKDRDLNTRILISNLRTPSAAKKAGNRGGWRDTDGTLIIVNLRNDWEHIKLDIMETLLKIKFSDPRLASKLVETFPSRLVEGNTWGDRFWGVCKGKGKNHLGRLLMERRDVLMRPVVNKVEN